METVDLMLSELDKPGNKMLSEWLLLFMQHSIEEGKSWKIERQVLDLAGELSNETYKSFSQEEHAKIHDKEFLLSYQQTLGKIIRDFERAVKEAGEKGLNLMNRFGLHFADFSGGSRSPFSHFGKWANGEMKAPTPTFINLADNLEKWTTKTAAPEKRSAIESAFSAGLNDAVKEDRLTFCKTTSPTIPRKASFAISTPSASSATSKAGSAGCNRKTTPCFSPTPRNC